MELLLTTYNSITHRTKGCHQDTSNGKIGNVRHRRIKWKGKTVCLVWQATSSILTSARMLSHLAFSLNREPILMSVDTAWLPICSEWTSLDLDSFPTNLRLSQPTKGVSVVVQVPSSTRESSTLKSQGLHQLPHRSRVTTCPTTHKVAPKHQPTRHRPLLSKQFTKVQKSIPWAPKTTTADWRRCSADSTKLALISLRTCLGLARSLPVIRFACWRTRLTKLKLPRAHLK